MPNRIEYRDKLPGKQQTIECKGVNTPAQGTPRHVIRTGNQNSASYADRSNYCSLREHKAMSNGSQISLSLPPRLQPGEKVLYFKSILWAATGKSLPSYRVSVFCPPIQEMGLYVTDLRVFLPAWVLRIFRVDWMAWFAEVDKTADRDYIGAVSVGRNRLFGPYLEIITYNPVQHWWRSPKARIRLFMKSPEPVCRLVTEALARTIPGSEPVGPANGSRPFRSEANQKSSAAGSRR